MKKNYVSFVREVIVISWLIFHEYGLEFYDI